MMENLDVETTRASPKREGGVQDLVAAIVDAKRGMASRAVVFKKFQQWPKYLVPGSRSIPPLTHSQG
jgi:hypothetical protein